MCILQTYYKLYLPKLTQNELLITIADVDSNFYIMTDKLRNLVLITAYGYKSR